MVQPMAATDDDKMKAILAAQHDYDQMGPLAKCRKCGRLAAEVRNSPSPACTGKPSEK